MSEQSPRDVQALAVHDRVRGIRVSQVMQPRVRDDTGHVACLDPEFVERMLGQWFVPVHAGEYPFPEMPISKAVQ